MKKSAHLQIIFVLYTLLIRHNPCICCLSAGCRCSATEEEIKLQKRILKSFVSSLFQTHFLHQASILNANLKSPCSKSIRLGQGTLCSTNMDIQN